MLNGGALRLIKKAHARLTVFGYVNVLKDELKIKDYNMYRAYYCGLCHELGKSHNQLVRLGLNYDFTTLAILLDSLSDAPTNTCMKGCIKRIGKRKTVCSDENLAFSADMNVLLAYYKLIDDIRDNRSFKAAVAVLPFVGRARILKKRYPELSQSLELHLKRLAFLEESGCDIVDKAAHEFAGLMECIFSAKNKSLAPFGYSMGRLIYILDAYDDMDDDFKKGTYNPAVLQYSFRGRADEDVRSAMADSLYYSLALVSEEYQKLDIKKNREILENIIYLGIRGSADRIINERKINDEKSV